MLSELIEALNIFLTYGDVNPPTHCEHDILTVCVDPMEVLGKDIKRLEELGFIAKDGGFISYKFGSA